MKREREYHGCGEKLYNVKKGKEEANHLLFNFEVFGKNIEWGKREGDENCGEDNQDLKKLGWGRISSYRELYTPCLDVGLLGEEGAGEAALGQIQLLLLTQLRETGIKAPPLLCSHWLCHHLLQQI